LQSRCHGRTEPRWDTWYVGDGFFHSYSWTSSAKSASSVKAFVLTKLRFRDTVDSLQLSGDS
jgi:hypothetical protein